MFSTDTSVLSIFDAQVVESVCAEPVALEGWLYIFFFFF
jgi:hypothetical protein